MKSGVMAEKEAALALKQTYRGTADDLRSMIERRIGTGKPNDFLRDPR